jgi:hypothetical protein
MMENEEEKTRPMPKVVIEAENPQEVVKQQADAFNDLLGEGLKQQTPEQTLVKAATLDEFQSRIDSFISKIQKSDPATAERFADIRDNVSILEKMRSLPLGQIDLKEMERLEEEIPEQDGLRAKVSELLKLKAVKDKAEPFYKASIKTQEDQKKAKEAQEKAAVVLQEAQARLEKAYEE